MPTEMKESGINEKLHIEPTPFFNKNDRIHIRWKAHLSPNCCLIPLSGHLLPPADISGMCSEEYKLNMRNPVLEGLFIQRLTLLFPPISAGKRYQTRGFH